jgi:hypothetical protein
MEKLPIETAPKDRWIVLFGGKPDMIWHDGDAELPPAVVARWDDEREYWRFCSYDSGLYGEWENPTMWAELP